MRPIENMHEFVKKVREDTQKKERDVTQERKESIFKLSESICIYLNLFLFIWIYFSLSQSVSIYLNLYYYLSESIFSCEATNFWSTSEQQRNQSQTDIRQVLEQHQTYISLQTIIRLSSDKQKINIRPISDHIKPKSKQLNNI